MHLKSWLSCNTSLERCSQIFFWLVKYLVNFSITYFSMLKVHLTLVDTGFEVSFLSFGLIYL